MLPFINIHTHKSTNKWAIQNIDQRDFQLSEFPFSIGLHPWFLSEKKFEKDILFLEENIPQAIAIGECGLDKVCDIDWKFQEKAFIAQSLLAEKYGKPLIIHCVKSYNELIELKEKLKPEMPWIIHGFNKKSFLLKILIEKGFFISFGKKLIHNPSWVEEMSSIPLEKVFFETDDSDILIDDVYLTFAKVLEMDMETLKNQIFNNFKIVFSGK